MVLVLIKGPGCAILYDTINLDYLIQLFFICEAIGIFKSLETIGKLSNKDKYVYIRDVRTVVESNYSDSSNNFKKLWLMEYLVFLNGKFLFNIVFCLIKTMD